MSYKEQTIENENRLLEAQKNSDHETLDELLHEDLLFHLPDGQIITKEMDLEAHRSGIMTVTAISRSAQLINVIGDTATVSVEITLQGKYSDQEIDSKFRYLRVWKLFNDQWKVIAGSCTQL